MPEYLAPGVYVEEVPSANKPIEGVSTSTAGMVGVTERGPVNEPTLVTSFADFLRTFGGYLDHRTFTAQRDMLPYAVEGFFTNGGQRVYITRIVGQDAAFASVDLFGAPQANPASTTLKSRADAGANSLLLDAGANIANGDTLLLADNAASEYVTATANPAPAGGGGFTVAVTPTTQIHAAGTPVEKQVPLLRVHARREGRWGNSLRVRVRPSSTLQTTIAANAGQNASPIQLNSAFGLAKGSVLSVTRIVNQAPTPVLRQRVSAATARGEVSLPGGAAAAVQAGDAAASLEYDLIVERLDANGRVVESEVFTGLGVDPEHSRYAPKIIGAFDRGAKQPDRAGESELIRVSDLTIKDDGTGDVTNAASLRLSLPDARVSRTMTGGSDDLANIDKSTYIGNPAADPDDRTGIHALENIDDISIVAAPGQTDQDIANALVEHCALMRYRVAVLDSAPNAKLKDVQEQRQLYDTTLAALYYPWLVIGDPFGRNGDVYFIPPSGAVAGIYARTDTTRGVHKAPANEVVLGVRDLQVRLTKGEQDILNPRHVNALRDFRDINRGLRVWGARTLSSDPEWKYVNVRRLFLFIEKSIERGTQFAVFEPNSEGLWATINRSVSNFLTAVWQSGALEGTKAEEAFFVKVDRTTMTQNDINNGRLIILVGIAPVKPAEFVIFRISQKTREATA